MTTEMKHTPTPWFCAEDSNDDDSYFIGSLSSNKEVICSFSYNDNLGTTCHFDNAEANAQHIVKCVNEYPELKRKADLVDELVRRLDWYHDSAVEIGDPNYYRHDQETIDLIEKAKELCEAP